MSDMTAESIKTADTERGSPLQEYEGSNLLCFSFSAQAVEFEYREFLRQIISFKNDDGFTLQPNVKSDAQRPPLEDVYLLFCECKESYEGIIRAIRNPDTLKANNAFTSQSGQLFIQVGSEGDEANCNYSVPVGAIKRGAQITKDLKEDTATIKLYRHGYIVIV